MKKLFTAVALAGMLSTGAGMHAFGQGTYLIDGDEVTCTLECEGVVEVFVLDPDAGGGSIFTNGLGNGVAQFLCTGSTPLPNASATYQAVSLTLTGNNPQYGDFAFSFDGTRSPQSTTITTLSPGNLFPAQIDVYAYVTGTIAGLPGTYISRDECHMRATINSFAPQNNEQYRFVNDVEFVEINDPDGAAATFKVPANSTVLMN